MLLPINILFFVGHQMFLKPTYNCSFIFSVMKLSLAAKMAAVYLMQADATKYLIVTANLTRKIVTWLLLTRYPLYQHVRAAFPYIQSVTGIWTSLTWLNLV